MHISTSTLPQWDPKIFLNIYPAQGPLTCSGLARKGTRRCGWELPSETEIKIETVLAEIAALQPREALRRGLLRSLAVLALCEGRKNERFNGHRWQLDQLMRKWTALITEAYSPVEPPHSVQQSPAYFSASQPQQALIHQPAIPAVSQLSSHHLPTPPATQWLSPSENMFKQEKPSIQVHVSEAAPATFEASQNPKGTTCHSTGRQYSQGSSLALEAISPPFNPSYEKPYPKRRGFLRRLLGCFFC
ncbi:hypothetical protein E6O75_ATG03908 [Venturia nashicola]|uniref:Uncharacterized protein n=1 Tax=Venturia nashicola TaxID=86259 RepID=A0A4Z1PBQ7_9PEZI|nr:hypothetical protein E6O75_ATG03908 [Venturia nashicola]